MPFLIYSITSNTLRGSCTFRGARPQTQRIRCIMYSGGFTQKKRARQGAESNATEPEILIRDSWRTRPTRLPCQRFVIMVAHQPGIDLFQQRQKKNVRQRSTPRRYNRADHPFIL